ncbi:hypothetical protein CEXT_371011 [Caerostris extrusa]|uniref:Uncharacterized protein n=1 Tax=Caerostris extrusa TaxID=172846 RepID=A0AAV4RM08_CAEEX|nr:hypothetical protein CEXT_371011 [Caerostris extrusa]
MRTGDYGSGTTAFRTSPSRALSSGRWSAEAAVRDRGHLLRGHRHLPEELNSLDAVLVYEDVKRKVADPPFPCPAGPSFVLGGLTSFKKEALDEVILFTENTKQWHLCSTLPVPLCGFATTSVPSIIENK